MKNILFVDDDVNGLKALGKTLKPLRKQWEMVFANNGKDALELMGNTAFDVVVSDMNMPEMDGVELLTTVMERHPEIIRIILAENTDREGALKSVKCTHQSLQKPCDVETIKYTIERTCKLQGLLGNESLRKIVAGIEDLPSLPTLYGMIVKEMQSPDASLKKVGYIISQDISMSAKILQMVNSAYFGLPRKMTDPQQAAVFLGLETLKGVILSSHVFSAFTDDADACGFSLADMWKHSLLTGRLAKEIAGSQNVELEVREEALTTGLLHDIGKLVLLKMPEKYKEITTYVEQNGCDFLYAEFEILQTSHAELGAYLLGLWGIDDKIVEAVAFHHNPSNLLEEVLFMLSNPTDDEEGKIKQKESNLKSWSAEKCSKEFVTLTSVHVANSLLVQNAPSPGGAFSPQADTLYLKTLNLEERMTVWEDACYRILG